LFEVTPDSPFCNACLVIKNWGDSTPRVRIDDTLLQEGEACRMGHIPTLEGTDLLIWISKRSETPVKVSLN
jgi:hypothetical protein